MTFLVGFVVAMAGGLTGVSAGSVTAPVLILLFGASPAEAVGTSLVYAAVIKLAVAPVYFWRKQVSLRSRLSLFARGINRNTQNAGGLHQGERKAILTRFALYHTRPLFKVSPSRSSRVCQST